MYACSPLTQSTVEQFRKKRSLKIWGSSIFLPIFLIRKIFQHQKNKKAISGIKQIQNYVNLLI